MGRRKRWMDLILWLQSGERDRLVPQIMQIWVRRAWHLQHARASRPRVFALRRVFLGLLMPTTQQTTIAARTKCVNLDSLARLATYALPTLNFRWIPHSCTHKPYFHVSGYATILASFPSNLRVDTRQQKQCCNTAVNPFQWVTAPRDRCLPQDAKRTMNLVSSQPATTTRRTIHDSRLFSH